LSELFECSGKLSGSLLDQLLQLPDAAVFFIFHSSLAVDYGTDSLGKSAYYQLSGLA
jgi:hypothetical protein